MEGKRGSGVTFSGVVERAPSARRGRAPQHTRLRSATIPPPRRSPAPACRRCLPGPPVENDGGRAAAHQIRRERRAVERHVDLQRLGNGFDEPFHIEEVDGRGARRSNGAPPSPVSATATRRDSPARVIAAPSSKRRTSVRSRCRLCATDVAGPAAMRAAAPRTAPTADCRSARSRARRRNVRPARHR